MLRRIGSLLGSFLFAATLATAVGCPSLDIPEDAQLRCTSNDACPSEFRCATDIGRCVRKDTADTVPPALSDTPLILIDGVATTPTGVYPRGTAISWIFALDERLFEDTEAGFVNPRARIIVDGTDTAVDVDVADVAGAFRVDFAVDNDAFVGTLAPEIVATDLRGNQATLQLPGVDVDAVVPAIAVSTRAPVLVSFVASLDVSVTNGDEVQSLELSGDIVGGTQTVPFAEAVDVDVLADNGADFRDVHVVAVDAAGNRSDEATVRFGFITGDVDGTLTLANSALPLVAGVRTDDTLVIAVDASPGAGLVSDIDVVFADAGGREVCRTAVAATLDDDGQATATTTTRDCAPAATRPTQVYAEAAVAFAGSAPRAIAAAPLYIDDDAPADAVVALVAAGNERNNATARTTLAFSIAASDAHPLRAELESVAGVSIAEQTVALPGTTTATLDPGTATTRDFTIRGRVLDEVGNESPVLLVVHYDNEPPRAPSTEARLEQRGADEDDPTQVEVVDVNLALGAGIVDAADRVVVRDADNAGADLVAARDVDAAIDVALPRGTSAVTLVAVDDAGNETIGANSALALPRLTFVQAPARPLGPLVSEFVVESSASANELGVNLAGALTVRVDDATAACAADGGDPAHRVRCTLTLTAPRPHEGRLNASTGAAVLRATLSTPRVRATVADDVIVDVTPPVIAADALRVVAAAVAADRVVGDSGAVSDRAGSTDIGAEFPPDVAVTFRGVVADGNASNDGAVDVAFGTFANDDGDQAVSVVAVDAAGNESAPVSLENDTRRPALTLRPRAARVRPGTEVVVDVDVVDASAVAVPVVNVGGVAATVTGSGTAFVARATVVDAGTATINATVVDVAGNSGSAAASIVVDATPPVLANGPGARTKSNVLRVDASEVAGDTVDVVATVSEGGVPLAVSLTQSGNTFSTNALPLANGHVYDFAFVATDAAGNAASLVGAVTFDSAAPQNKALTILSDAFEAQARFLYESDDTDIAALDCSIDGSSFVRCTDTSFGFANNNTVSVGPGPHELAVSPIDTAGNVGEPITTQFTVRPRRVLAGDDGVFCAVDVDSGRLFCWGDQRGELDSGDLAHPTAPVEIPPPVAGPTEHYREVAVQDGTICATTEAALYCWGDNTDGRALQPLATARVPLSLAGIPRFSEAVHSLVLHEGGGCAAIDSDNSFRCWGRNLLNPNIVDTQPQQLPTGAPVTGARARGSAVCVTEKGGVGRCFGANAAGQALTNTLPTATNNNALAVNVGGNVIDVSTSGTHACAVTADRVVVCAGDNTSGAVLGREPTVFPPENATVATPTTFSTASAIRVVAAGARTCILAADGIARCIGQLAHGEVVGGSRVARSDAVAVAIDGAVFDDLVADDATVCGIERGTSRVLCVGENGAQQIDDTGVLTAPVAVPLSPGEVPTHLEAAGPSLCFGTTAGRRFCVGDNRNNAWLVDQQLDSSPRVRPTSDFFLPVSSNVSDVFALNDDYACGLLFGSALACAGSAGAPLARLASNDDPPDIITTAVPLGGGIVSSLKLSEDYGCALSDDFFNLSVRCWGARPDGTTTVTPAALGAPDGYLAIAVGDDHVCAVVASTNEGEAPLVRCLGGNARGQLGNGTTNASRTAFTTADTTTNGLNKDVDVDAVVEHRIAARGNTTCFATAVGVGCFGDNTDGIAGAPLATALVALPRRVDGVPDGRVEAVAVARSQACAVVDDNVFCWGGGRASAEQLTGFASAHDVAISDDGTVCVQTDTNQFQCAGSFNNGMSLTGLGFVESATEVVLP